MGHVYIVNVEGTSLRKIGIADEDIERRLASLQVGCPYRLILERAIKSNLYREFERLLHAFFVKYHVRGEWFDVPIELIDERLSVLRTFILDEECPISIEDEDADTPDTDWDQPSVPTGQYQCPLCKRLFSSNNIKRHVRSCREIMSIRQ